MGRRARLKKRQDANIRGRSRKESAMRWFFYCSLFIAGFVVAVTPSRGESLARIYQAIGQVESGNNDKVRDGDDGMSIGRYQIQYRYWKDSGVPGKYQDCRKKAYAEKVMKAYWKRYCPKALASGNAEVLARVHNGGPAGYRYSSTLGYWKKVKSNLR